MGVRKGKSTGASPSLNVVTGSVVNTVQGYARLGRLKVSGNDPKRNSMVSGNTGLKRKGY